MNGKQYVVLRSADSILAVYRVRRCDGKLKGMRRWPAAVEQAQGQEVARG